MRKVSKVARVPFRPDRVGLRYDFFLYLDDRMSTENRSPNPEHWLWLQYEARF